MHHKLSVALSIAAVAMLLLSGCSGKRGLQGESGTAECVQCHSDNTTIMAIDGQWNNSVHATGGNFARNTPPCSGCHTSEGFIALTGGATDPGTPANPSPVGCFACHEPHTNKNFNLRTTAPVTLEIGGGTYDRGLSNLCASCHHARTLSPALSASVTLTSNRWGPHHGPQADILNGSGAYVFAGQTYRNSPHKTVVTDGCPTCHMAAPYGTQAGGHTMHMTYDNHGTTTDLVAGCNNSSCHSGLANFDYQGLQDTVAAYTATLRSALVSASLLDDASDLPKASSSNPLTMTESQAGALYNYLLLEADRSSGVHNSKYVIDALKASIGALASR